MWLFDEACRDGVEDFLILSGGWAGHWPFERRRWSRCCEGKDKSIMSTLEAARWVFPSPVLISSRTQRTCPTAAGDHLYRMDYREFVAAHRAAGADITVAALPCAEEQAQAFGLMKIDDSGR